jgi:hypothetical protein
MRLHVLNILTHPLRENCLRVIDFLLPSDVNYLTSGFSQESDTTIRLHFIHQNKHIKMKVGFQNKPAKTNFMESILSRKSTSQVIPPFLWNPKFITVFKTAHHLPIL